MGKLKHRETLDEARVHIAKKVRDLRKERRWTQAQLASRLHVSQGRLSVIERGAGSFTAEQFLLILKLFNVGVSHFAPSAGPDQHAALQNALARLGGHHLHEDEDVLPAERLERVHDVIRETIVAGDPRLVTALAPVLVTNIDDVSLQRLDSEFVGLGLHRRLYWVVENVLQAIDEELARPTERPLSRQYRRAATVLSIFAALIAPRAFSLEKDAPVVDVLDAGIRSTKTLDAVRAKSSLISRRWGITTDLQPEDFARALRAAHAAD